MLPFCFPVAVEATVHLVTMEVDRKQNGTEAWFSVTCACGCDQGAVIVSLDQEAVWLAAGITETIEQLSGPEHRKKTAQASLAPAQRDCGGKPGGYTSRASPERSTASGGAKSRKTPANGGHHNAEGHSTPRRCGVLNVRVTGGPPTG